MVSLLDQPSTTRDMPLVLHLVHGTWPYGRTWWGKVRTAVALGAAPVWFDPTSSFVRDVSAAAGRAITPIPFAWSGDNSFMARHEAAVALRHHLERHLVERPDAVHAVVGHSHGGTVAFEAVCDPRFALSRPIAGLMTLATPFVSLRRSTAGDAERVVRAALWQWERLLLAAIVLAVALGVYFGNILSFLPASVLLVGMLALFSGVAMVRLPVGLAALLPPDEPPLEPASPLVALRAPGDEASLAIGAAQFSEWALNKVWKWVIVLPLAFAKGRIEGLQRFGRLSLPVAVVALYGIVATYLFVRDLVVEGEAAPFWLYALVAVGGVGLLIVMGLAVLLVFVPLVLVPGMRALASATGPEASRFAGFATVDAEPLPSGIAARMLVVPLTTEERRTMAMRHSVHELPVVRAEVGAWLRALGRPKPKASA